MKNRYAQNPTQISYSKLESRTMYDISKNKPSLYPSSQETAGGLQLIKSLH